MVIRLFCEGEVTEKQYFSAFNRLGDLGRRVRVDVDPRSGSPSTLVRAAVARRRDDPEVDQWWCVFDVESPTPTPHGDLFEAVGLARREGVPIAVSNPCFEVWLLLHVDDVGGYLETKQAEHRCEQLAGYQDKVIDPELFLPRRADAVRRAGVWARRHEGDGTTFPSNNPSSSVAALVAVIDGR